MSFRDIVKNAIITQKVSVKEIAEGTGYSVVFIYDLLKGARRFNEESEEKICKFLGITKTYEKDSK